MTEEVVEKTEESIEVNPVEERASELGWMPKEAWIEAGKNAGSWRSAELFVELEPLFGKIDSLKKEIRNHKQTTEVLKKHYEQVRATEYKRALDDLKAQKRVALEEGDAEAVVAIDDEIATTRSQADAASRQVIQQQAQEIHPDFAEWVDNNSWYATDKEMQAFADSIGQAYALSRGKTVEPSAVLKHVEKKVKQAFPEKFKNVNQSRPSPVEKSTPTKKAEPTFELNDDERRVMNKLVKQGVLTEEQYIKDLKKIKEIQ